MISLSLSPTTWDLNVVYIASGETGFLWSWGQLCIFTNKLFDNLYVLQIEYTF